MNSYRNWSDPGGRMLSSRLDRLRDTFDEIASRLRSTVASAVGEALGGIIREAVLHTLGRLTGTDQSSERSALSVRQERWSDACDRAYDRRDPDDEDDNWQQRRHFRDDQERENLWRGDRFEDELEPDENHEPSSSSPSVPVIAVAAGLQASAWCLWRWTGNHRLLATLGVGLLTGGLTYAAPSLASSIFHLAGSALQLAALGNACGASRFLPAAFGVA